MALPTSGLTLHVDASNTDHLWKERNQLTTPVDGDEVLSWDDKGAAVDIALKGNVGPLYRASSFNGRGCLDFDGVTNALGSRNDADSANIPASSIVTASTFTMLVSFLMEAPATTDYNQTIIWDTSGTLGLKLKTVGGVHTLGASNNSDLAEVQLSLNTKYVAMMKHAGGQLSLSLNKGLSASVASGDTSALNFPITNISFFNGKIGEMAFYNTDVTGSDLAGAWDYFMERWVGSSLRPFRTSMISAPRRG